MVNIPTYEQWMRETAGAFYERRNDYLRALDQAIKEYHERGRSDALRNRIKACLDAYIGDHTRRKGADAWKRSIRNANQAMAQLMAAFMPAVPVKVAEEPPPPRRPPQPEPRPIVVDPEIRRRLNLLLINRAAMQNPSPPLPRPQPGTLVVDPETRRKLNDVLVARVALQPQRMPTPKPLAINAQTRSTLNTFLNDVQTVRSTPKGHLLLNYENAIEVALTSMSDDLTRLYVQVHASMERTRNDFKEAITQGGNEFEVLHRQDAEDTNFKIDIAGKIFKALSSLPFPLSVIGSIGEGVASALKTETFKGPTNALAVRLPDPTGFTLYLSKITGPINELRTMNVNPTRLGGFAQFRDAFHLKFQSFENALHESWALETNGIKDAVTRRELARAMLGDDTFQNPRTTALMLHRVEGLRREISAMGQEIAAKFQNFTSLTRVDPHQVGIWVTIQFIADYALNGLFDGQDVRQMTASDLANKTLGNEFVRFLASDEVGILHLNPVSGQSATYYENGKIPWDDRPTHRVSIFLYLDWMNRTLNPFELFDSNTTPAKFREWSSSYIWRLGRAIEQVKETHMFGHNTVEPQRVIGAIASQQAEAAMWNAMY